MQQFCFSFDNTLLYSGQVSCLSLPVSVVSWVRLPLSNNLLWASLHLLEDCYMLWWKTDHVWPTSQPFVCVFPYLTSFVLTISKMI